MDKNRDATSSHNVFDAVRGGIDKYGLEPQQI